MVAFLVEHGASLAWKDGKGTALYMEAINNGQDEVARLLIKLGVDTDGFPPPPEQRDVTDPVNDVLRVVQYAMKRRGVEITADRLRSMSLIELGLDQLDQVELVMELEELLRLDELKCDDEESITLASLIEAVSRQTGIPIESAGKRKKQETPVQPGYVLRCPHCERAHRPGEASGRRELTCPGCKKLFLDLGPLPVPMDDVLLEAVVVKAHTLHSAQVELPQLPKWACPWCGGNVGVSRDKCRRCGCDLTKVAAQNLQTRAASESTHNRGLFYSLALEPIGGRGALLLLGRLGADEVMEMLGDQELASRMHGEEPPPLAR